MGTNPARILAATGVALGVVLLLSRSKRPRGRGGGGQRPVTEQEGLPEGWPAAVTLGMGRNEPNAWWVRQQAPAEIVTLAEPLEAKGMWPGRLGPFLALMAHQESGGDARAPGGWFGLTPDLVFTRELAPLRAYPDLLNEPRFAVLAAARRIDEMQRRYENAGLTWLDVARAFVPKTVPEQYLVSDRPGIEDAGGAINTEDLIWQHAESRDKYESMLRAMAAYNDSRDKLANTKLPWVTPDLADNLPPFDERMMEDQIPSIYPYDANTLFSIMGIDYRV